MLHARFFAPPTVHNKEFLLSRFFLPLHPKELPDFIIRHLFPHSQIFSRHSQHHMQVSQHYLRHLLHTMQIEGSPLLSCTEGLAPQVKAGSSAIDYRHPLHDRLEMPLATALSSELYWQVGESNPDHHLSNHLDARDEVGHPQFDCKKLTGDKPWATIKSYFTLIL